MSAFPRISFHLPSGNQKRFWRDPMPHIAATEGVSLCARMKS
jgi:hypothetical protein